eukprot:NODE_699_length_1401_cov_119.202080.p1 GENE.NODE_699_length_1401_cov_119.202080~~NODE_699_length_1401_cov_119.202080.p1  ORF type:complete len:417 (-),score=83.90 NODE_699_length_1401_cov_119.202080:133-1383(-)
MGDEASGVLAVVVVDRVMAVGDVEFGTRVLDPAGPCGVIDANTTVFVSRAETIAFEKVHVLPYADTLPGAYSYDLFRDFLQPFFQAHPFASYGECDHFVYRGVRFRVIATDPPRARARVSNRTLVYSDGRPLQQVGWDLIPPELRADVQRLPRGLQELLLNVAQMQEVHEVLERGHGLSAAQVSQCGKALVWRAAEHTNDTQQQCMVCLSEFAEGEGVRLLVCTHLFHRECIDEWLQRSAACPICKHPVSASSSSSASPAGENLMQGSRVAYSEGRAGTIVGFDVTRSHFRVRPEGGGREDLVAAEDLVQCLSGVRLTGLTATELNGRTVQIVGHDKVRDRYQARLDASRTLGVRRENCILPDGAVARVVGLSSTGAAWNGYYGRVVRFDGPQARHIITVTPERRLLSVRPQNLHA